MADPRRSADAKSAKSIRSLSAPAFQVRNNRTCFLRKIFAVNNDDLSYLARPPMGETNQTVAGQNKSAAKMSQKQVNLWFKDRKYLMDKLDKAEDDVYQRLLAIHKTKIMIEKARDASPDRSSIALYSRRASRATNYRGEEESKKPVIDIPIVESEQENKGESNPEEGPPQNADDSPDGKAKPDGTTDEINTGKTETNTGKNESVKVQLEKLQDVPSPREIKAQETSRINDRPNTQANVASSRPTAVQDAALQSDRAKTEMGLIDETAVPPVTPKLPEPERKPKLKAQIRLNESITYIPKKSQEGPKSHARRIEEKILGEPFTYWMQDPRGKLVPSDVPYKRREFPLPDERDDEGRKRDFLELERKSKQDNRKRFSNLCDDLVKLDEWNPLDEIRAMAELRRKEEKDEAEAEERWKKLGMLRHWVRAFGMREAQELKGLDPNSKEALEKCKYIRKREKTNDDMDTTKRSSRRKEKRSKSKDVEKEKRASKKVIRTQDKTEPLPSHEVRTGQELLNLDK